MTRYAIDPEQFTDGQWEELYNASTIMPRTLEARHTARTFKRDRKYIELAISRCLDRADEVAVLYADDTQWAEDLRGAANVLRGIIGAPHVTRKAAIARLWDLLTSDIYTDAHEYAERIEEVQTLLPVALGRRARRKTS